VFSPALGGWRNLMFIYGGIAFVISLLWLQVKRRSTHEEASEPAVTVPFRQSLSHVVRIKAIWLMALSNTCLGGCCMAFIGYLPLYLRGIGWTAISADGALAALSAISVIGCIPLSILSDRIGLRKAIIYPSYIITIVCVGLFSVLSGIMVWPLVLLIGVVREALFAILITMVMETEGVGKTYSGTSLGMISTINPIGGFFAPPIGNRLALINPSYAFLFWAALAMVGLSIFRFTHETGWRKRPLEN
jgi:Na+/melibiose symporter-like transporter